MSPYDPVDPYDNPCPDEDGGGSGSGDVTPETDCGPINWTAILMVAGFVILATVLIIIFA